MVEVLVGGPGGSVGSFREACMVRSQTVGGQTDVCKEDVLLINGVAAHCSELRAMGFFPRNVRSGGVDVEVVGGGFVGFISSFAEALGD